MAQHGAAVKEMEAGAIAWVAQLYQVPLLCVKVGMQAGILILQTLLANLHCSWV